MTNLKSYLSSDDIRTRILNQNNVVIFDSRIKQAVAGELGVFDANPGSGQTTGFAPSALREEPELVRIPFDTSRLHDCLRGLDICEPAINSSIVKRQATAESIGVVVAPPEWQPEYPPELSLIEKVNIVLKLVTTGLRVAGTGLLASLALVIDLQDILARKLVAWGRGLSFSSLPKLSLTSLPRFDRGRVTGFAGQGLIITSIVVLLLTVGPILRLQGEDWWRQSRNAITGKAEEPAVKPTLTDTVRKPEEIPPEEKQFQLLIPKLGANMKVVANVDAGSEKAYSDALKKGVAHAAGSGLPGEENATNRTIYIFGHSTNGAWNIQRYNALFYSLKDAVIGDEIILWFWGKEYRYSVTEVIKTAPSDLSYFEPQILEDRLILQTCWPPGTTWKRLLVIAKPKNG